MYKENSPSPEKIDSTLFVEEDRRVRRRGSQLYVVYPKNLSFIYHIKAFYWKSLYEM